jgi:ABC-type polysaccharide/polyol phosphate transport system ATPase subunit
VSRQFAISVRDVGKRYRLFGRKSQLQTLKSALLRRELVPRAEASVEALRNISFDVGRGEAFGVIGRNGSGKSTLLKLISGILKPTTGQVLVDGRVSALIELGAGFHPEISGRENIYINGIMLGLTRRDIDERFERIVQFAGIGPFLDQPVKTYSSGMYMRLAFSVAVNVDPDVLVIDEALAVGDGHFQKKCIDRIREFQKAEKTILFCSHALYYVTTLCHRTLWLDRGTLRQFGNSIDVVHDYETFLLEKDRKQAEAAPEVREELLPPVRITSAAVESAEGETRGVFSTGEDLYIRLNIDTDSPSIPFHILISVNRAADDMQCFMVATKSDGVQPLSGERAYDVLVRLESVPLLRGDYALTIFVGDENAMHVYDRHDVRPAFSVGGERYEVGIVAVRHSWETAGRRELASSGV